MPDIFDEIELEQNTQQKDIFDEIEGALKEKEYSTPYKMSKDYLLPQWASGAEFRPGEMNIWGDIFQRPGDALLSLMQGKGYKEGAINPQNIEGLQELALKNFAPKTESVALNFLGGLPASTIGLAGDIARQPANLIALLGGQLPGVKATGQAIAETKPAQAVSRFMTKPRSLPNPLKPIKNLVNNIKSVKNPTVLAKEVRSQVFQAKKQVGEAFSQAIDDLATKNPNKKIDVSEPFEMLKQAMDDVENQGLKGEIKSIIRKTKNPEVNKLLTELIDDPSKAKDLNLQQVQQIKTSIQQAPSIATKLKQGRFADYKPADLEILDLLDEIKLAQSEAFPELAQIRKPYAEYMTNYREVKNYFKPKSLINKMRQGFGNEEIEAMVKSVMPKEVYSAIKGFRNTGRAIKWGSGVAATGIGLAGANKALNAILSNR